MDELIQYKNIIEGTMSAVGRRPLLPNEYDEATDGMPHDLVDEYKEIVVPSPPGLVSSFAIATHPGDISDKQMKIRRLIMDRDDVLLVSRKRDKMLLRSAILNGLLDKMQQGAIRPQEAA